MNRFLKLKSAVWMVLIFAFSGCGSSKPVADDLVRFMNSDITKINANCEVLREEAGRWESLGSDEEFIESIAEVMVPNINASIELLENVEPETEEVEELKEKYMAALLTYRSGFETLLQGFSMGDTNKLESGSDKIKKGNSLLDAYNASLASLASENNLSIDR